MKETIKALKETIKAKDELINHLQTEIKRLRDAQLPTFPAIPTPYLAGPCLGGGQCFFPSPWFGTVPPNCSKCGKQQVKIDWSCTTVSTNELTLIDGSQLSDDKIEFGCGHGRQVGVPCPHCLGINNVVSISSAIK